MDYETKTELEHIKVTMAVREQAVSLILHSLLQTLERIDPSGELARGIKNDINNSLSKRHHNKELVAFINRLMDYPEGKSLSDLSHQPIKFLD